MSHEEEQSRPARLSHADRRRAEDRLGLKAPIIYESIRIEGEHELSRPFSALWWAGVGAGIGISAAVMCKGFLHHVLPDAPWRPAVTNLGYTVGFLIVILGRLQLFTENTITVILPLLMKPTGVNLLRIARLWTTVFLANMVGCFVAALLISRFGILPPGHVEGVMEVSRAYAQATPLQHLAYGAPAGFLIAALVWILPSVTGGGEFFVIMIITYMIGLGDLSHVVAGATELFLLVLSGEIAIMRAVLGGIAPSLLGNILGGTGLFALLAYAQVREEI